MSNSNGSNMWKVIQGLNGTPDANSPNEGMSHNSRTITDIKSKANVFINYYTRVGKLNMSQSDRGTNRQSICWRWELCSASNEWITICYEKDERQGSSWPWQYSTFLKFHLWLFKNYYPYSTHHSHLLTAHESGGLPLSFHYSKLANLLVK